MTAMRRGACPSLSAPMPTGDGLLVRLNPRDSALSPRQLGELARAAARFGNGMLEITSKGSLQIRGLTVASAPELAMFVDGLGIDARVGVPVETAPLAGLDPEEIADPRPLAEAIRARIEQSGLTARLGPKVSVVVDGGGRSMLGGVKADVGLTAKRGAGRDGDGANRWRLALGGDAAGATLVATIDEAVACDAVLEKLAQIAALGRTARGRDLLQHIETSHSLAPPSGAQAQTSEVSSIRGDERTRTTLPFGTPLPLADSRLALRIALPFGAIDAATLAAFADTLATIGIDNLRLSPDRSLLLLCANAATAAAAKALADTTHQLITDTTDPRLAIVACAGAPACASGHFATRAYADDIAHEAAALLAPGAKLHLSGCDKRCAEPAGPSIAIIGRQDGCAIVANGTSVPPALREYLARRGLLGAHDRRAS